MTYLKKNIQDLCPRYEGSLPCFAYFWIWTFILCLYDLFMREKNGAEKSLHSSFSVPSGKKIIAKKGIALH